MASVVVVVAAVVVVVDGAAVEGLESQLLSGFWWGWNSLPGNPVESTKDESVVSRSVGASVLQSGSVDAASKQSCDIP